MHELRRRFGIDHDGAAFVVVAGGKVETVQRARPAVRASARRRGGSAGFVGAGIDDVLAKMREVFASLYNDRAISYRVHKGYAHGDVALPRAAETIALGDTSEHARITYYIRCSYAVEKPATSGVPVPGAKAGSRKSTSNERNTGRSPTLSRTSVP